MFRLWLNREVVVDERKLVVKCEVDVQDGDGFWRSSRVLRREFLWFGRKAMSGEEKVT